MGIVFFCQSCGARFDVHPQMAGKKGRCKTCGQRMTIPKREDLASVVALSVPPKAAGSVVGQVPPPRVSALDNLPSNIALKPLSVDRLPALAPKAPATPLDDATDSKPYSVIGLPTSRGRVFRRDNPVLMVWRKELGGVQHLFRHVNDAAYLLSVPFLMILLFGAVTRNRPVALLGATAVVLLNIGRFVTAIGNLAVVPLRDGPDIVRLKKALRRLMKPVVTVGLVVLAYTFIPGLSRDDSVRKGPLGARLKAGVNELEADMKDEVKQVEKLDFGKLGESAQRRLKALEEQVSDPQNNEGASGKPKPEAASQGLIKDVGKHVRDVQEESSKQP